MRDPTRGGVSATTNEIAVASGFSLVLKEKEIPLLAPCRILSEILGLEPLDIANEGKMLIFVAGHDAARALRIVKAKTVREKCRAHRGSPCRKEGKGISGDIHRRPKNFRNALSQNHCRGYVKMHESSMMKNMLGDSQAP